MSASMKWAKISSCRGSKDLSPHARIAEPMVLLELLGALFLVSIPIAAVEGATVAWMLLGIILAAIAVGAVRARLA
jgi:hypothetical protein